MYTLYILERLSLAAPREYIHSGLILELDMSPLPALFYIYFIFLVCLRPTISLLFVPTIHISHVHPPLTTRQHNTAIQVNNMGL